MTYYCADCNYCLRGLPDDRPCPECGSRSRRVGPRGRRVSVVWLIAGAICATGWGLAARPLWNRAFPSLMCTRQSASGTWSLHSPMSGQYASIQIKASAASETGSKWRSDTFTSDYEIKITPLRSRKVEEVTLAGKDIDTLTVDAVIDAMTRAGANSPRERLRTEADYVVRQIAGRLAAVRASSSGLSKDVEQDVVFRSSGSSLGSLSTPFLPDIFVTLWWAGLVAGWVLIALLTWWLARRPRRSDADVEVSADTPSEA